MNLSTKQLTASLALAGVALLVPAAANAATITWDASVNMYQGSTVETFVDNSGTLAVAQNVTGDATNGNVSVNGVAFTQADANTAVVGIGGESITVNNNGTSTSDSTFGDGEFSSNADIFHLIRGGSWNITSVSLAGLDIGTQYSIQVFNNDARSNRHAGFVTGYDDGTGSGPVAWSNLNNSPNGGTADAANPEVGDSIIGTFTADAATQNILLFGSTNGGSTVEGGASGRTQINALQLRIVPEPSSLALLGLGGLLIARRRRG